MKPTIQQVFAKRLRVILALKNISGTEVIRRISGSSSKMSNYTSGAMLPSVLTLCTLADALETTPDVLLGYKPLELD